MRLHTPGTFLSIGAPVPNTNVYVLDEDMKPCPIGEPGVMWAGGACVSKGYINLPDKTSSSFNSPVGTYTTTTTRSSELPFITAPSTPKSSPEPSFSRCSGTSTLLSRLTRACGMP